MNNQSNLILFNELAVNSIRLRKGENVDLSYVEEIIAAIYLRMKKVN